MTASVTPTKTQSDDEEIQPATPDSHAPEGQGASAHLLDTLVADPSDLAPLCDEPRFTEILEGMVTDTAPRVFAVVQEYGERVAARIAAWGMAFEDHAEVVSVEHEMRMGLQTPEEALRGFTWGSHIHARLVWFNFRPTPAEDDEAAS